ncbi:hypothetical protein [Dactylosporangium sp. CA-092794]|uniref:hypothetical protein n=1 Tax=Dactylosporangium sp. CA-092794 TaxID=3239929 RepID=UPI003D8AA19C
MKLLPIVAGVSVAVAAAAIVVAVVAVRGRAGDDAAAAGGQTVAGTCPATWSGTAVRATRTGALVPEGARSALLCSYPNPAYALAATRRMSDGAEDLTGYLNHLPTAQDPGTHCALIANTEHVIVFEYAGREPAVAYARNCAWDLDGAVRYGGDIRKVTAYWSVTFRD